MEVTLGFRNLEAMAGLNAANQRREPDQVVIGDMVRTALGEVSQALQDDMPGLDQLPSLLAESAEQAKSQFEAGVRVYFRHDAPQHWVADLATVFAKVDGDYMVALPNPYWDSGSVIVCATVSESLRTWTILQSGLGGRPMP